MNYIQKFSKIRGRGQMTIPREIREVLNWPSNEMIVKIETTSSGFKVEPLPISHPQHPKKRLTKKEADMIMNEMKRISKLGRSINLTNFLRKDRDSHF